MGPLPGEFHGQWSLTGYSPWDHKESDTTERLTLSLSWVQINNEVSKHLICSIMILWLFFLLVLVLTGGKKEGKRQNVRCQFLINLNSVLTPLKFLIEVFLQLE